MASVAYPCRLFSKNYGSSSHYYWRTLGARCLVNPLLISQFQLALCISHPEAPTAPALTGWGLLFICVYTPVGFNEHWGDLSSITTRLAPRQYVTSTGYDGLNRATQLTLPAEPGNAERRPMLRPSYNRNRALAGRSAVIPN